MGTYKDKDLEFLGNCNQVDLKRFADIMRFDAAGKERGSSQLMQRKDYVDNQNFLRNALPTLIDEFQRWGGHSVLNQIRRHGVCYRTILEDICDRLKVPYESNYTIEMVEQALVRKILMSFLLNSEDSDFKNFASHFDYSWNYGERGTLINKILANAMNIKPLFNIVMPLIMDQVDLYRNKRKEKKWYYEIFKEVEKPSDGGGLGKINVVLHKIAYPVVGAPGPAYRVIFPCTLSIIYMRIKCQVIQK